MRATVLNVCLLLTLGMVPASAYDWLNVATFPDDLLKSPYAWSNVRIEDPLDPSYRIAADDFLLTEETHLTRLTFWSAEVGEPDIAGGDWYIYAGGGSMPGKLLAAGSGLPLKHQPSGYTHGEFGTIFENVMDMDVTLPAGHYFLAYRTWQGSYGSGGKNNNVGFSTVAALGNARALWSFDVLADGTVTGPWYLLEAFDLIKDNEWSFRLEGGTGQLAGDLNCDGKVDAFDIDPFVLALTDVEGYQAKYPDCDYLLADINGDGKVDAFDIDPFVDLLTGG